MKKLFLLIIVVVFSILFIVFLRSETYFFPYPDIDTAYASEFTYNKFSMVRPGMSKDQVRQLLGSPFTPIPYVPHDYRNECWPYSQDGRLWPVADFAWIFVRVCFKDGKVFGTYKSVIGD